MPICERDPWRYQYFEDVACPADINIPTDDVDSFEWFPHHRWIYDKLNVARSQNLPCGRAGELPPAFPVFAKPNRNLKGMGRDSGVVESKADFDRLPEGHMWMPLLSGEHISTDIAVVDGKPAWMRHALGFPWRRGMFTHWIIETRQRPELNGFLMEWVEKHMAGYTGMVNIETIGGTIIEAHLRFADQWCDLYGRGWFDALVRLYAEKRWNWTDPDPKPGYSVPLFARHGNVPPHPPASLQAAIRAMPHVSSLQITFYEARPGESHPMPPGGFRLGIVNATDLEAGRKARLKLAEGFPGVEIMLP